MNSMYDVAIIGLGPAGSTLARLLSKEFNIIAIDKNILLTMVFKSLVVDYFPPMLKKPLQNLI